MPGWHKPLLVLVCCALATAYVMAWRAPAAGTYHDDGVYMVTAKAMAEGKGYRIISLPQEIPQTKYPVLFPMLLSAVWRVFPDFPANIPYLKLIALISAMLWFVLVYRLLREEGATEQVALVITLLTASSGLVIYLSTAVLAETLFAMLTTASLIFLRKVEKSDSASVGGAVVAGVLAALAFHTRTIGIALLAAGPVTLLIQRKSRHAIAFTAAAVTLCAPWLLWQLLNRASATTVDSYQSLAPYKSWNVIGGFTFFQKIRIVASNIVLATAALASLAGFPQHWSRLLPAVPAAIAVAVGAKKLGLRGPVVFLGAYVGVTLLWAWAPIRFLAPVLPLIYWCGHQGIGSRRRVITAAGVILFAVSVFGVTRTIKQSLVLGDALPELKAEDSWYQLRSLMEWAKVNTPPDAVLAGNLDPLYYLYTGRKAIRGFMAEPYSLIYSGSGQPIGSLEEVLSRLAADGVTHWLLSPNTSFSEGPHLLRIQVEAAADQRGTVRRLNAIGSGSHDVLEIRRASTAHAAQKAMATDKSDENGSERTLLHMR
jgi:hypothetical protein